MKTKFILPLFIICTFTNLLYAQNVAKRDSLLAVLKALPASKQDTDRVILLSKLAFQFHLNKPDTAILLAQQAYDLAHKLQYLSGEGQALNSMGAAYSTLGDYPKAVKLYNQSKDIAVRLKKPRRINSALNNLAFVYADQGDWQKALEYQRECYNLNRSLPNPSLSSSAVCLSNLGEYFYNLKQLDSATYYLNQALPAAQKYNPDIISDVLFNLGDVATARNQFTQAQAYYRKSIDAAERVDDYSSLYEGNFRLAKLYEQKGQRDSALIFAELALTFGQKASYLNGILKVSQFLTALYKGKNDTKALRYFEIATAAKDSLFSQDKVKQMLTISFDEKQKQQEKEAAEVAYRNTIRLYEFGSLLVLFAVVSGFLYRNNRRKQRANNLLQKQKEEIQNQRLELQKSLAELNAAQNQLVQKEKLASLGELTAGIAHEIQNPLNFVNNFSVLSVDLAKDLKTEIKKPEIDKDYVEEILTDLTLNQEKINLHGKRASSIVKSMLEHSRVSTGERELTDINKLADEYLRLSYHGLRAKDKNFNADYKTDFDTALPNLNVVPQDIGRVLLNLINNAFWAVNERSKNVGATLAVAIDEHGQSQPASEGQPRGLPVQEKNYTPLVIVSTKKIGDAIEITVRDNGNGIPKQNLEKVFQPFFTTKPTGQGTGLGLSLAYDIITKGHGGELKVESEEGVGSEFMIHLPLK